jgi:hypothetical protein
VTGGFAQLLLATIALLLLGGLQLRRATALTGQLVILNAVLVASSTTDARSKRWRRVLMASWLINLVLQIGLFAPSDSGFFLVADAAGTVMLGLCVWVILAYVLQSGEVTADTLFASVVAYLFIGLAFARVYEVIQTLHPGSFGPSEAPYSYLELSYFSLVTIATLGYGDILPRIPLTQVLSVLEAVVGQFYVAMLVAWLVSAYMRDRERRRSART